jgi:phage baseplate assembly protein W
MATYYGLSTNNCSSTDETIQESVNRKRKKKRFRLTDTELVVKDLENAFAIKQGEVPGKPQYGTTVHSFLFEPSTPELIREIENEFRRVVGEDPRIVLGVVSIAVDNNQIAIAAEISVQPFDEIARLSLLVNATETIARILL